MPLLYTLPIPLGLYGSRECNYFDMRFINLTAWFCNLFFLFFFHISHVIDKMSYSLLVFFIQSYFSSFGFSFRTKKVILTFNIKYTMQIAHTKLLLPKFRGNTISVISTSRFKLHFLQNLYLDEKSCLFWTIPTFCLFQRNIHC